MKKRVVAGLLAIIMTIVSVDLTALSAPIEESDVIDEISEEAVAEENDTFTEIVPYGDGGDIAGGTYEGLTWSISSGGDLLIEGTWNGEVPDDYDFYYYDYPWAEYADEIITAKVKVDGIVSLGYFFSGCNNMTSVDLSGLDTSKVVDMNHMFYDCSSLTQIDVSNFMTYKVENMSCMFGQCEELRTLDLRSFTTPNVKGMSGMFRDCYELTSIRFMYTPGIGGKGEAGFTTANVTSMSNMFYNCIELQYLDVSHFDTSSVTDMSSMFEKCKKLDTIDVSSFDTSNVTSFSRMFAQCLWVKELDVSGFITDNATDMSFMFSGCKEVEYLDVEHFNTSNVTNMMSMFSMTEWPMDDFSHVAKLESLNISGWDVSNVTDMGNMFSNNIIMKSIDIPKWKVSNVTRMGSMFNNCDALTEVDMTWWDFNENVTTEYMFQWCDSLERLYINKTLPNIGWGCFDFYDGNKNNCALKDIYYTGFEEEWKKITIADKNEKLDDVTIHYNYIASHHIEALGVRKSDLIKVGNNKYGIRVLDKDDRALEGATVKYGNETKTTGKNGYVEFDLSRSEKPQIKVTKDGYMEWNNNSSAWFPRDNHYEEIRLYDLGSEAGYLLQSAFYVAEDGHKVDLLRNTRKVMLYEEGKEYSDSYTFQIACALNNSANVQEYILMQGGTMLASSKNGWFDIDIRNIPAKTGGNVYVLVTLKDDSQSFKTFINLSFISLKELDYKAISFGDGDIEFTVPGEVPYFGDLKHKFNLPEYLPVEINVAGDGKIHIGFNIHSEDAKKEKFEKFEKSIEESHSLAGYLFRNKDNAKELEEMLLKKNKCHMYNSAFDDIEVSVCGYGEGEIGDPVINGRLYIVAKAKLFEYEYNTVIDFVPCTFQMGVKGEIKIGADGDFNYIKKEWTKFETFLAFKATVEVFGGVGYSKLLSTGAYGSGELEGEWTLSGKNRGLKKLELTAEMGTKAYIAFMESSHAYASKTWPLYSANSYNVNSLNAMYGLGDDNTGFVRSDLSYLRNESKWGETGSMEQLMTASIDQMTIEPLLTGTYNNAQPDTSSGKKGIYLTMLKADPSSERVYTVVGRWDGSHWGELIPIDNDALLDDSPKICVDDEDDVWLAYTKVKAGSTTYKKSLVDWANDRELTVARLNPDTLTVEESKTYNGDGYISGVSIANIDGQIIVTWKDSEVKEDKDLIISNASKLYKASAANGSIGEAELIKEVEGSVVQVLAGKHENSSDGVAYTVMNNDLSDPDSKLDCSLWWADKEGAVKISDIGTGYVSYDRMPGNKNKEFVWNGRTSVTEDGEKVDRSALVGESGKTVIADGLTGYYDIADNSLFYSTGASIDSEGTYQTYVKEVAYDEGKYTSSALQLADTRYFEDLNAEHFGNNNYLFGMNTQANILESDVAVTKDLVWAKTVDVSDIVIESVDYDLTIDTAGENVPISITVVNNGTHAVSSVQISVNGKNEVKECSIDIGEKETFTYNLVCPETETEYLFSVSEVDRNSASGKNECSITLGYPDLEISAEYSLSGEQKGIVATVNNTGADSASGKVILYDTKGVEYESQSVDSIDADSCQVVSFWIPKSDSNRFDGEARVTVEMIGTEKYTYNNTVTVCTSSDEVMAEDPSGEDPDEENEFTVEVECGHGGSVTPAGINTVNKGDQITITILPYENYDIKEVIVDGINVGAVEHYTLNNISEDHYVFVRFVEISGIGEVLTEDIPTDGVPDGIWIAGVTDMAYTGKALTQDFRVYDGTSMLALKTDYTVKYKNNKKVYAIADPDNLTATDKKKAPQILITMKGNYSGKEIVYFSIDPTGENPAKVDTKPYAITGDKIRITDEEGNSALSAVYNKSGAKPSIRVMYEDTILKEGRDYTLKFTGNTKYPASKASVTVTGKGNYTSNKVIPITITQRQFSKDAGITVVASDKAEGKKAGQYMTTVKVFDSEGKLLKAGTDYDNKITYLMDGVELTKTDYPKAGDQITVRVTGKGGYTDSYIETTYSILASGQVNDIGKATFKIKNQVYNKGKAITITSQDMFEQAYIGKDKTPLKLSTDGGVTGDFMVVPGSYVKNTAKGTAKVTLMGINGKTGTKTVSYSIGARSLKYIWFGWIR